MPRVYYHLSKYISHRTAGSNYIDAMLAAGIDIVSRPEQADIVIIHDDPLNYESILSSLGKVSAKLIAYSVWETEELPQQYVSPLKQFDEIWTCSPFSARAFSKHFKNIRIIPHIVGNHPADNESIRTARELISHSDDNFYFFTIVDAVNPRKNFQNLLQVFIKTFTGKRNVFLVVKQHRFPMDLSSLPQVIDLPLKLSPQEISALHSVCSCYVSLHHAEAWGLPISDAMSAGKPVIATGYSGNMYYMNNDNSLPVKYSLVNVPGKMCSLIPLYTADMVWAEPDLAHASYLMKKLVKKGHIKEIAYNAKLSMEDFKPEKIGMLIRHSLSET